MLALTFTAFVLFRIGARVFPFLSLHIAKSVHALFLYGPLSPRSICLGNPLPLITDEPRQVVQQIEKQNAIHLFFKIGFSLGGAGDLNRHVDKRE